MILLSCKATLFSFLSSTKLVTGSELSGMPENITATTAIAIITAAAPPPIIATDDVLFILNRLPANEYE